MNEAVKADVLAAVAKWRPRLRLMDWSIAYEWDDPGTYASQCFTQERYRRAKLHFAPDFPSLNKGDVPSGWLTLEKLVVHELCHIVVTHLHDAALAVVQTSAPRRRRPAGVLGLWQGGGEFGKAAQEQAFDRLAHANEFTTEWVARMVWEAWERTEWDAEPRLTKG